MTTHTLRYGCNPHQTPATVTPPPDANFKILNGAPGYINLMDALGAWQLVRELKQATGKASAASFKHTSPAGAAIARPLSDAFRQTQFLPDEDLSPVALAYVRARGGDRLSAFGDAIAVSETVDVSLAKVIKREVSDLIIAPDYDAEALDILRQKKGGKYLILQIDPNYSVREMETRELFGFTLQQKRNDAQIDTSTFSNVVSQNAEALSDDIIETLIVGNIALKYTQSNSVCVVYDGQVIGMGAGQQSRIHCTRIACDKADKWLLQQHPTVLHLPFVEGLKRPDKANLVDQFLLWDQLSDAEIDALQSGFTEPVQSLSKVEREAWIGQFEGLCLCSDAFIPFRDNIDRASRSGVQVVSQPGGAMRDDNVTDAATQYGMTMVHTGLRLFLH